MKRTLLILSVMLLVLMGQQTLSFAKPFDSVKLNSCGSKLEVTKHALRTCQDSLNSCRDGEGLDAYTACRLGCYDGDAADGQPVACLQQCDLVNTCRQQCQDEAAQSNIIGSRCIQTCVIIKTSN